MNGWFRFKARVVWLFGVALSLAGFVGFVYFTALVTWKGRIPYLPELDAAAWFAERLQVGILCAALGALVTAGGAFLAARQSARLRAEKVREQDRLRRVRQYRGDEAHQNAYDRREPFIGPESAGEREPDRRVA